jgi:hypothetical protein
MDKEELETIKEALDSVSGSSEVVQKAIDIVQYRLGKIKPILTQEKVRYFFNYDPETGLLTWKNPPKGCGVYFGDHAGSEDIKGYRRITLEYNTYKNHNLIWLYVYGSFPQKGFVIDHDDNNPRNTILKNLRLATNTQNSYNRKTAKNNKTGVKGVFMRKGKFCVNVGVNNKMIWGGCYDTLEEAEAKVISLRNEHHGEFANHGDKETVVPVIEKPIMPVVNLWQPLEVCVV